MLDAVASCQKRCYLWSPEPSETKPVARWRVGGKQWCGRSARGPFGLLFAGTLQGSLEEASRLQLSRLLGYEDERFLQGASLH
jgi:hypothetical protein